MSKSDNLLKRLHDRKIIKTIDTRLAEAEMREKHPAIKEAYEQYLLLIELYRK